MASGTLPPDELIENIGVVYSGGTPQQPIYKIAPGAEINYTAWPPDDDFDYGNETDPLDQRPLSATVPIASAMIFLSILTTLGNALVIHAIRTEKRLQTVANYFICSLAVADLLIGLYVMPLSIAYFVTGEWHMGLIVCQAWLSVDYVCSTASIFNLFILSLDRYWSIRYPLKYLRTRTVKRASIMITLVWVVSSLWVVPVTLWHVFARHGRREVEPNHCDTEFAKQSIFKVVTGIANFYVPMGIMVGIYCKIFHEIRKRSALDLGRRDMDRKSSCKTQTETIIDSPRDLKNRANEEQHWANEDLDSTSSSKETSENDGDKTPGKRTKGKQAPINLQLKNISHLTFLTMGLHPGMLDGKGSPIKEPPRRGSRRSAKLDHSNCSCSRLTARPKETKLVTNQETEFHGEKNRPKHLLTVDYTPKDEWNEQLKEELRPLREQDEELESKGSNGCNKSILRRSNTAEQIFNGAPKIVRRISFSNLDEAKLKDCKVTYDDAYVPSRKLVPDHETIRIHEPRCRERNNRGVRNGTVCRLLSNDTATSGSGGTESEDEGGSPRSGRGHGHVRLSPHGTAANKFSLNRFRTSIKRQGHGRASETLKRIRKMSITKEKKAAKQLGIIVGCFVSCWLPYFIVFLIVAFCEKCVHPEVYNALIWLGYINSTLNPFIYPMCNTNFRKAFKRILHIGNVSTRQRR
ncbi:histamine H1 receptor-like [Amphiura filiformis]|uniref:histamine H1 receptor-like n=1 Tax=Amphiura filiformis TaxID=82378 RepID=UPI003B21E8F6